MNLEKILRAEKMIAKKCFLEVIPRFQNIPEGISITSNRVFYEYDNYSISIKSQALLFLKVNHSFLRKAVILEWAKFLEKINHGLPRLISKIEGEEFKRNSLNRYQLILEKHFDRCFYCANQLSSGSMSTHVDHFIPWSYIFEDELWNLVLTCRKCNLRKHSSLPDERRIKQLVSRNTHYSNVINELRKSLRRLDAGSNQEQVINKYYQNCLDYGFTKIDL
jgi:hypothetical protein